MIKVAYIINYIAHNGPSNVVLNIIKHLPSDVFEVSLITLFSGNDRKIVEGLCQNGIVVIECKKLSRKACLVGQTGEVNEYIARGNYDVVHSHGIIPDIVVARINTPAQKVSTIHNNMFEDYILTYGELVGRIMISMHMWALKRMNVCVCCSLAVLDVMKARLHNAICIRNGIDQPSCTCLISRGELGIPEKAFVAVYIGKLSIGKNVLALLHNFSKVHKADEYLMVIGTGVEEVRCKRAADDHVLLLGYQENVSDYLKIADAYLSASVTEGFSVAALEALSNGLMLLLSDIPSHREMLSVPEEYIGEVFENCDFAQKLTAIRAACFESKREMRIDVCNKYFSGKDMAQKYEKLYQTWA